MASVIGQGHGYADGTLGAKPGWAWVGERGPELAYFHGGEKVMSHEQSLAALHAVPAGGYYAGTSPSLTPDQIQQSGAQSLRSALRGVETRLDAVVKATKGVGSDTAAAMNSTGRRAGNRSTFNTTGRLG
jgi:phage-related tail protein